MRRHWLSAILLAATVARPMLARPASLPAVVTGNAGQEPGEDVQLDLSPGFSFEVRDLSAGAVAARLPFLVSIRHARLAPGKALRISVSLDEAAAPGTRLSFQPGASHGGTCRAGSLLPGVLVPVFESAGSVVTGGCELRWNLDSLVRPRHAGSLPLTLHWKLESVAVSGSAARVSGPGGTPERGTVSAGSHSPSPVSPAAGRQPRAADVERPERRRPPL